MKAYKSAEYIQYTGMEELKEPEKRLLDKIATEYHAKIKKQLHNITDMSIHLKMHSKTGNKHRYEVHTKAIAPTRIFAVNKVEDWDFSKALQKSLNGLQMEIKKHIKETKDKQKVKTPRKRGLSVPVA